MTVIGPVGVDTTELVVDVKVEDCDEVEVVDKDEDWDDVEVTDRVDTEELLTVLELLVLVILELIDTALLSMYRLSLFAPPQYSREFPVHSILQPLVLGTELV